jgi:SpoVK/Ycf46/Vps4 family AAA+-type ATPase
VRERWRLRRWRGWLTRGAQGRAALEALADETDGFSMADLDSLVRAAALAALRESVAGARGGAEVRVSEAHVRAARAAVVGSLSDAPQRRPRTWASAEAGGAGA